MGSATIKKYGILNPFVAEALGANRDDPAVKADVEKYVSVVGARAEMNGIAFPGTFFLDRRGRVTSRYFENFYIGRNTVSSVLVKQGGKTEAAIAGTKISNNHLEVTSYVSNPAVAVGNRFSVVLEAQPHEHLHVYEPGAEKSGYRVISLILDPNPQIQEFPLRYPTSEIYNFKPTSERVPLFQTPL